MVTICQMCGGNGFSVALIYCDKCQNVPVHRYCLDKMPATFTEYVTWFCEDCEPNVVESSSKKEIPVLLRKSDRLAKPSRSCNALIIGGRPRPQLVGKNINNPEMRTKVQNRECRALQACETNDRENNKGNQNHKPSSAIIVGRGRLRPRPKLPQIIRKKTNAPVTRKRVQNHKTSPVEACKTNNSEKHKCDQKAPKRRRLTSEDTVNADRKTESKKLHKDLEKIEHTEINADQKAEQAESSKNSNEQKPEKVESDKIKFEEVESSKVSADTQNEKQNMPIMEYKGNTDQEADSNKRYITDDPPNTSELSVDLPAQPIVDPVWRGRLGIADAKFNSMDGLAAHLSTKACKKVRDEAQLLPDLLSADMLPRADVWPKSFKSSDPGDAHIALYFFPETERDERVFDDLVGYMIEGDLAMRAEAVNAELLIFTSIQLPLAYWRFQAKYYLWGVFRRKQTPVSRQQYGQLTVHNSGYDSGITAQ